jgi:deazaflavin-dependent oxidoreductase (nitroreductase family)
MSNLRNRLGNPLMALILRSPLHSLLSRNFLLITVTGRQSGRAFTTPVNYARAGEALLISSSPDRTWWKNLRGGSPVALWLQGKDVNGTGRAIEDRTEVAQQLIRLLTAAPHYQHYLGVSLAPDGRPLDPAALSQAAQTRVIIEITDLHA